MILAKKTIHSFQEKILTWYQTHKRDLPWRKTRDPYKILISEVMLQQTQVSRVIPKYEAWLTAFPTVHSLAKASVSEVLRLWSSLGYNRRALYLQKAAQETVEKFNGEFPKDHKILQTLPGIGDYTARAVACFAFDAQIAVVDTNVRKIILVEFFQCHPERSVYTVSEGSEILLPTSRDQNGKLGLTDKEIQEIADQLLPKKVLRLGSGRLLTASAYEWNQALMDYSSAVLKKEKIPIAKQSKFLGSNRYYRGQIIKRLLHEKQIQKNDLYQSFVGLEEALFEKIIASLEKDGFIKDKNGVITLR